MAIDQPPPTRKSMRQPYLWMIWTSLILFACRISSQVFVGIYSPTWLPPWEEWYWGFVPYPPLFLSELSLLMVMTLVAYDSSRKNGWFFKNIQKHAIGLNRFVIIYFFCNALRYVMTMALHPDHRWLKGTIPIGCHFVLILFLYSSVRHTKSQSVSPSN